MTDLAAVKTQVAFPRYREPKYNEPHLLTSETYGMFLPEVGAYPQARINAVGNESAQGLPFATPQELTPTSWMAQIPFNYNFPRPEDVLFWMGLALGSKAGDAAEWVALDSAGAVTTVDADKAKVFYRHHFTTNDLNDLRLWSTALTFIYEQPPSTYASGKNGLVERWGGVMVNSFDFGCEIGDSQIATFNVDAKGSGSYAILEANAGDDAFKQSVTIAGLTGGLAEFNTGTTRPFLFVDNRIKEFISGEALSGSNMAVYLSHRTKAQKIAGSNALFAVSSEKTATNRNLLLNLAGSDLSNSAAEVTDYLFSWRLNFSNNVVDGNNRKFNTRAMARGHRGNPMYTIGLNMTFHRNQAVPSEIQDMISKVKDGDELAIQIVMRNAKIDGTRGKGILLTFPAMQSASLTRGETNNELNNELNLVPIYLHDDAKPMYLDGITEQIEYHSDINAIATAAKSKFTSIPSYTSE